MAKEGKNNFELKKGKRFQFDLSKNPKRTFDLVKDVDDASAAAGPIPTMADTKPPTSQSIAKPQIPVVAEVQPTSTSNGMAKGMEQPATKKDEGKPSKQGIKQLNNQNNKVKQPKDTASSQKPLAPAETDVTEESGNEGRGSNKWMWIIGAILVVAIIAWLCVRGCSSSNDNGATAEPTVEAVEATGSSEEEAVVEEPTTGSEAEQPASSDVETESPTAEEAASASTATTSETPASTPASTPATVTSETASRPASNAVSAVASVPAVEVSSDIEAEAMKVIRGEYGTGLERKLKLGSKYREIQTRVNELKRLGAF